MKMIKKKNFTMNITQWETKLTIELLRKDEDRE